MGEPDGYPLLLTVFLLQITPSYHYFAVCFRILRTSHGIRVKMLVNGQDRSSGFRSTQSTTTLIISCIALFVFSGSSFTSKAYLRLIGSLLALSLTDQTGPLEEGSDEGPVTL